jgi:hypothetical protein
VRQLEQGEKLLGPPGAVTSAVAISVLTILGYEGAFVFQVGYLGSFGVPMALIDVGIRELLVAAAAALVIVLLVIYLILVLPSTQWRVLLQLFLPIFIGVMCFALILQFRALLGNLLAYWFCALSGILIALLVVFRIVRPLSKGTGSALNRWRISMQSEPSPLHGTTAGDIDRRFRIGDWPLGSFIVVSGGTASLILLLFYAMGTAASHIQSTFELVQGARPCIVVAKSGEALVCAVLSSSQTRLTGEIVLLKPEAGAPIRLRPAMLRTLRRVGD